jgi:hypothetical protein
VVAVGHHDDVAFVGPVAHRVVDRHPARPGGHDVEERQPVGSGHERIRQHQRCRLERERLGELTTEEQSSVEAEVVEREP